VHKRRAFQKTRCLPSIFPFLSSDTRWEIHWFLCSVMPSEQRSSQSAPQIHLRRALTSGNPNSLGFTLHIISNGINVNVYPYLSKIGHFSQLISYELIYKSKYIWKYIFKCLKACSFLNSFKICCRPQHLFNELTSANPDWFGIIKMVTTHYQAATDFSGQRIMNHAPKN
jgi:hypothetical protein